MFHVEKDSVKTLLLKGKMGLEKENLRVTTDGGFTHTPHPFKGDKNIVYDFCENQVEVNGEVSDSEAGAIRSLREYNEKIQSVLYKLCPEEMLWHCSNPPYIKNDEDIPIAYLDKDDPYKRIYREHLAKRYGKYKMSLCGIHVNYSFSHELLQEDFKWSNFENFSSYKNHVYLDLAGKLAIYGWLLVALTAASPVTDLSFVEKGKKGGASFMGMASIRCSELGYWNYFTPVFDYKNMDMYTRSIEKYVQRGILLSPTELYYPVRIKPKGGYNLEALRAEGAEYIELRMFDINPLEDDGINIMDMQFTRLFIVWLSTLGEQVFIYKDQIFAAGNFKNAAHYDLKTVNIVMPGRESTSAIDMGIEIIGEMEYFYREFGDYVREILAFQKEKLLYLEKRYGYIVKSSAGDDYMEYMLELSKEKQKKAIRNVDRKQTEEKNDRFFKE